MPKTDYRELKFVRKLERQKIKFRFDFFYNIGIGNTESSTGKQIALVLVKNLFIPKILVTDIHCMRCIDDPW